ncbi:MarR family transcriptional regulator [Caballeronia pedi]|nr:MarR family transcriptional regulator [Caballeronia pedi]
MRGNENYERQDLSKRAPKKRITKPMPLNQRLVLEALKRRRHATLRVVVEDLQISRDILKNVFVALEAHGYIERVGKSRSSIGGQPPVVYRWSGKSFPSSAEMNKRSPEVAMPVPPALAALVAGMHAMCCIGRAAA